MIQNDVGSSHPQVVSSTVCVIGSGPAGATVAHGLAAHGIDVIVLEGGSERETPEGQSQLEGESVGREYPIERSRRRALGGTSVHWNRQIGLRSRPLDPCDFQPRRGMPDWPFEFNALWPYYDHACRLAHLEPFRNLDVDDTKEALNSNAFCTGRYETRLFQLAELDPLQNWFCSLKSTKNVRLHLRTPVIDLELDGDTVRSAVAVQDNRTIEVRAKVFVLAGGGLENPRLLLAARQQAGIGNRHDLVGRYFMEHPHVGTGWLTLFNRTDALRMQIYFRNKVAGVDLEGYLAPHGDLLTSHGLPNHGIWLKQPSASEIAQRFFRRSLQSARFSVLSPSKSVRQLGFDLLSMTDVVAQRAVRRIPSNRQFFLEFEIEQTPLRESRLMLSERRDEFGMPRVKLDWRIADSDIQAIRKIQDLLDHDLRKANIGRIDNRFGDEFPREQIGVGNHHMGTTRMHTDPKQGVVDPDCRVHDVSNLYVAGSSVFPRGGAANPTLTIMALSCRLVDHLTQRLSAHVLDIPLARELTNDRLNDNTTP